MMGVVVNMRPDLFKAVVADVPFVDVINTMSDSTIPLTTQEWLQWGDPRKEPWYSYMKSYSPYDNVTHQAYPAMLVTAGLNDPNVSYWEPAKFVAKLRATKTDDHMLLLRTNMGAGHQGASGRYDALHEWAIRYAFILDQILPPNGATTAP
jgi:oligopeptidase B